jgi:hypothetical protein
LATHFVAPASIWQATRRRFWSVTSTRGQPSPISCINWKFVAVPIGPQYHFRHYFRANGGTQYFNNGNGTTGASEAAPGANVWQSYQVVISDTAGTRSASDGNGSLISYYANGVELGGASIGQLTAGQGYIGFDSPGQIALTTIQSARSRNPAVARWRVLGWRCCR